MDNFHQCGKYSTQIAIHQAELRIKENMSDQKYLSISSLQTDYVNLDRRSGCGKNSEREDIIQTKFTFCGSANHSAEKCFKRVRKEKKKVCAARNSDNRHTERTARKCSGCRSEDHLISKCTNPPKDD